MIRRFAVPMLLCLLCAPGAAAASRAARGVEYQTRYYRIWTDVDETLARDLCARMDAMYDEYARRFAGFAPARPQDKFSVYIFARRADYIRHTDDRLPNTGGIFIPSRKQLACFLEGQGRDGLRRTLQHEAFHQFAHAMVGGNIPIWLNEGIAQVFEEAIWTGRGFIVGQVPPRRVRPLQQDLRERKLLDFHKLLAMSENDWAAGLRDPQTASVQYNQSWAMAHFLIYATDSAGAPLYRARVIQLLHLLRAGTPADEAFVRAFSDNIDGFQQRFVEYAQALRPSVEATCIENQSVLADMLVALNARGRRFETIDAFREELSRARIRMHYTKGPLKWSTAEDASIYLADALGRPMPASELYFYRRHGAPLPDIVCMALDGVELRTRFHQAGERIEYEVLVQPR